MTLRHYDSTTPPLTINGMSLFSPATLRQGFRLTSTVVTLNDTPTQHTGCDRDTEYHTAIPIKKGYSCSTQSGAISSLGDLA